MSDPYPDPQSGILKNKFDLSDQESLDRAESDSVSLRSILLPLNPLKGNFDAEHLKAIHSYLFQDVYLLGKTQDGERLQIPDSVPILALFCRMFAYAVYDKCTMNPAVWHFGILCPNKISNLHILKAVEMNDSRRLHHVTCLLSICYTRRKMWIFMGLHANNK